MFTTSDQCSYLSYPVKRIDEQCPVSEILFQLQAATGNMMQHGFHLTALQQEGGMLDLLSTSDKLAMLWKGLNMMGSTDYMK